MTLIDLHDAKQAIWKFLEIIVLSICLFIPIQLDSIVIGSEKLPAKDSLPASDVLRFKIEPPPLLDKKPHNVKKDLQSQPEDKPISGITQESLPIPKAVEPVLQPKGKTPKRIKQKSKESSKTVSKPVTRPKDSSPVSQSPESSISSKRILQILSDNSDQSEERITIVLSGFFPPETNVIEGGEPRIVCDFLDVRVEKNIQRLIDVRGRYVMQIRTGIHPPPNQKTRVVLDLVPEKDYEVEQLFYEKKNAYTLIIRQKPL